MTAPSGKRSAKVKPRSTLANAKSKAELMSARSTSADPTNRRRSDNCRAANATACTSRKMLRSGANVLLLDEPTNDLDVDTLRALEVSLSEFAGCVLITSHDRWFLDRIATHILAYEGDSQVVWFEGNYEDYEADKATARRGRNTSASYQIQTAKPLSRASLKTPISLSF